MSQIMATCTFFLQCCRITGKDASSVCKIIQIYVDIILSFTLLIMYLYSATLVGTVIYATNIDSFDVGCVAYISGRTQFLFYICVVLRRADN
jgi:hypothetical protein